MPFEKGWIVKYLKVYFLILFPLQWWRCLYMSLLLVYNLWFCLPARSIVYLWDCLFPCDMVPLQVNHSFLNESSSLCGRNAANRTFFVNTAGLKNRLLSCSSPNGMIVHNTESLYFVRVFYIGLDWIEMNWIPGMKSNFRIDGSAVYWLREGGKLGLSLSECSFFFFFLNVSRSIMCTFQ